MTVLDLKLQWQIIKLMRINSFCQGWHDLSFGTVNNNAIPWLQVSLRWLSRETSPASLPVCGSAWLNLIHPPVSLALPLRTASGDVTEIKGTSLYLMV